MRETDRILYSGSEPKDVRQFTPKGGFRAWVKTLWPLVLHCIFSIGTAVLVARYINDRHFNLEERRPPVSLADGMTIQSSHYGLLQSDVATIVSATLVILRVILGAWAGSLCWRSVFLLMERTGLQRQDLKWVLSFGVFTPPSYFKDPLTSLVGVILLATLLAATVSPILTGSIAWTPSNRRVEAQGTIMAASVVNNTDAWNGYSYWPARRQYVTTQAAGHVATAWGRDFEKGVLKRVLLSATGLNVNSTISSVTLPYFSVTGLEWISDPMTLTEDQRNMSLFAPKLNSQGNNDNPLMANTGTAALIPDTPWSPRPLPQPSVVSETRLLVLYTTWAPEPSCQLNNSDISLSLPPSMGLYQDGTICLAFARVTYSAGVAECTNCRISSPSTVQNDTALDLRADAVTTEALRLMPDTMSIMVLLNASIPSTWGDIDDYVIDLLGRSYSGAWTALTDYLGASTTLNLTFSPSVPSLRAQVDMVRVFAWLGIQIIATLCGILFLLKQAGTEYKLVGDTTLTALELDASEATGVNGEKPKDKDLLKLAPKEGGLKVVVEKLQS